MITTDDFLEHYGVKGMRWGVRRKREPTSNDSEAPKNSSKKRKAAKIAGGVVLAAVTVAGAAYVRSELKTYGNVKFSRTKVQAKVEMDIGKQAVKNLIRRKKDSVVKLDQKGNPVIFRKKTKEYKSKLPPIQPRTAPSKPKSKPKPKPSVSETSDFIKKLVEDHEKSRKEFDEWLTEKEREQGYKYKGPKDW